MKEAIFFFIEIVTTATRSIWKLRGFVFCELLLYTCHKQLFAVTSELTQCFASFSVSFLTLILNKRPDIKYSIRKAIGRCPSFSRHGKRLQYPYCQKNVY